MFHMKHLVFVLPVLLASPAAAHDWYSPGCCEERDCEPIPIDGIEETRDGWHVHYISPRFGPIDQMVRRANKRDSHDGGFHGCWMASGENRCLYVPVGT